jgi:hypothetical protein
MDISLDSLEEALSVRRQIETLEKRLAALLGGSVYSDSTSGKGDGHMSAVYKSPQKKGGLTPQRTGLHYCRELTIPRAIPTGNVLVHNHVRHAADTPCGINGFRAWMQNPDHGLERCKCGWSGLPHYRVKRNVSRD